MGEVNKTMVALDCGNSSYRVVLGRYRDGKIESTVIKQIPNRNGKSRRVLLLGYQEDI